MIDLSDLLRRITSARVHSHRGGVGVRKVTLVLDPAERDLIVIALTAWKGRQ